MYKWSLLLLAFVAAYQPIAAFTERNLVDGRQQCCDHPPHSLRRDTRLDTYGNNRLVKVASEERSLNGQRDIPDTRRYEVRSVESVLTREKENPSYRRDVAGRITRYSRLDRRSVTERDAQDQRSQRRISQDRENRVSVQRDRNYREFVIRSSRDDSDRVANERRSRASMVDRREQRLLSRETNYIRDRRTINNGRNLLQRTGNDVVQADIRNRRDSRGTDFMDRRSFVAQPQFRTRNVRDNNREYRSSERRVQDASTTVLPLSRSRIANENMRMTNDDKISLNRRVTRELYNNIERRARHVPEYERVTESRRANRIVAQRIQAREDFSQERRTASLDRRFDDTIVREVRLRTRSESAVRSENRQTRINKDENRNNVRDSRRNTIDFDHRNVRFVDRSDTRDNERRFTVRSQNRRALVSSAETRRSFVSREEPENENRRTHNIRKNFREIREDGRFDQQTREGRRITPTNIRNLRSSSEGREINHSSSRISRDDIRSRIIEERLTRNINNDRRLKSSRYDVHSNSRNKQQDRHMERRMHSADRRMERARVDTRESLGRLTRAAENVRSESLETRFNHKADAQNQRTISRFDEKRSGDLRQSRNLERDVARIRDARINDERIRDVRETRNMEVRNVRNADKFDSSVGRVRLSSVEAARYRHDFVSKKTTEQESYSLNWQYLFYTLQGIYLCGVIVNMMNQIPDTKKTRSWWGLSTKAASLKVD